jgi:hypothetical protein
MGHYDDAREYYNYQNDVERCRRFIRAVQSGKYKSLVDAASISGTDTITIQAGLFQQMLDIVGRLDAEQYTYNYQRDQ